MTFWPTFRYLNPSTTDRNWPLKIDHHTGLRIQSQGRMRILYGTVYRTDPRVLSCASAIRRHSKAFRKLCLLTGECMMPWIFLSILKSSVSSSENPDNLNLKSDETKDMTPHAGTKVVERGQKEYSAYQWYTTVIIAADSVWWERKHWTLPPWSCNLIGPRNLTFENHFGLYAVHHRKNSLAYGQDLFLQKSEPSQSLQGPSPIEDSPSLKVEPFNEKWQFVWVSGLLLCPRFQHPR